MNVKIQQLKGKAAVVAYYDEAGMPQAVVISASELPADARQGQMAHVSQDAISTGTEYGVDWGVMVPDLLNAAKLQKVLRDHGVWTIEDFLRHPGTVREVLMMMATQAHTDMQKAAISYMREETTHG